MYESTLNAWSLCVHLKTSTPTIAVGGLLAMTSQPQTMALGIVLWGLPAYSIQKSRFIFSEYLLANSCACIQQSLDIGSRVSPICCMLEFCSSPMSVVFIIYLCPRIFSKLFMSHTEVFVVTSLSG